MRRRRPFLAPLLALLALAGAPVATPAVAQDCGPPEAPCAAGGGTYHLALPEGPGPHPLMMFLHGWGGRADATIANRGLVGPVLARGWAVLAPQGAPRREGDRGGAWNAMASPDRREDVGFLQAVLDDAAARAPVDRGRVLAAGFSGGGMMVWRLACAAPEAAFAHAPVAGLMWRPQPEACAGPVRLLHTHGWTDQVVPLEGRSVAGGRITQGDLFVALDLARRANGCVRDDPDVREVGERFWRRRWTDCAAGSALEFALFAGGHRVPEGWAEMALDWVEALEAAR